LREREREREREKERWRGSRNMPGPRPAVAMSPREPRAPNSCNHFTQPTIARQGVEVCQVIQQEGRGQHNTENKTGRETV